MPMDHISSVLPRSQSFLEEVNEVHHNAIIELEIKIKDYEGELMKLNETLKR